MDTKLGMASKSFYTVIGPPASNASNTSSGSNGSGGSGGSNGSNTWTCPKVDCWFCLKPKSVTQTNRCYIPVRDQGCIDGSFRLVEEIEDRMTRCYGFFCSWQCTLAYCQVYFPHRSHKVHDHAARHGFVGYLEPTLDPRFVQRRFNPFVSKTMAYGKLRPDPHIGKFMRQVPVNEQQTAKFPDARIVLDEVSSQPQDQHTFPEAVMDSERLIDQLDTGRANGDDESGPSKRKVNKLGPKSKRQKQVEKMSSNKKEGEREAGTTDTISTTLRFEDFL